ALLPQAGAQRLPAGNPAGVQLSHGAAGNPRPDPAEALPAPARRADLVPVAPGQHAHDQPLGPGPVQLRLRRAGGLALAGVLRDLARDRRMAVARSEMKSESRISKSEGNPKH